MKPPHFVCGKPTIHAQGAALDPFIDCQLMLLVVMSVSNPAGK
jgi:hypothetical protein